MSQNYQQSMTQAFYSADAQRFTSTTARLFAIDGPLMGMSFPLATESATIGRHKDSTVSLPSPGVSKTHCTIVREADDHYCIIDQGSRNGTEVNGRLLEPNSRLQLAHGDRINICEASFFFLNPKNTADVFVWEKIDVDRNAASEEAAELLKAFPDIIGLRDEVPGTQGQGQATKE